MNNFNLDSELMILGSILNDNNLLIEANYYLKEGDFYYKRHKFLYSKMNELYKKGIEFDLEVLINYIRKAIDDKLITITDLGTLNSYISNRAFSSHVNIVKEYAIKRELSNLSKLIINNIDRSSNELVSLIQEKLISCVRKNKLIGEDLSIVSAIDEAIENVKSIKNNEKSYLGVETGFNTINEITNGLNKGDFIIIGGRPGVGKTSFALNLIKDLPLDVHSLFVQIDMREIALAQRLLAIKTGIENGKIARGKLQEDELIMLDSIKESINNNITIFNPPAPTFETISLKVKELKMKKNLQVVIVDHIGKIRTSVNGKGKSIYEHTTDISANLKALAKELDVTIIAISQLNRKGSEYEEPTLGELRDSGALEADADIVAILRRANNNVDGKIRDLIAYFLKCRDGKTGNIELDYNLETQEIKEKKAISIN